MTRTVTGIILVTLLIAATAHAQTPVGPSIKLAIVPVGGLALAAGDGSDNFDPSLSVGGEVDVKLGPLMAITGTVIYNEFSIKVVSAGATTDKVKTMEFGAGVKYNFAPTPVTKPFLRFGLGMYNHDIGASGGSETKFGINGGAGVDIDLPGSKLGFTAVARYHNVWTNDARWKYFNVHGGIRFSLM